MMEHARAATRRLLPTSPFGPAPPAPPAEQFAEQDQVTHDKYGLGRVISIQDDATLVIDFGECRMRITMPCAKLAKLLCRRRRPASRWAPWRASRAGDGRTDGRCPYRRCLGM